MIFNIIYILKLRFTKLWFPIKIRIYVIEKKMHNRKYIVSFFFFLINKHRDIAIFINFMYPTL